MFRRLRSLWFRLAAAAWRADADGFQHRVYPSDRTYRAHQGHKVHGERLDEHDARLFERIRTRFHQAPPAAPLVCLGARNGAEVRAFRTVGTWAIGVDVASDPPTPLVLMADFHALPFRPGSVRTVFSNTIDHVRDLNRFLLEIHTALAADGVLLLDAVNVARTTRGSYEALWWPSTDALIRRIESCGFALHERQDGKNWIHLTFSPVSPVSR